MSKSTCPVCWLLKIARQVEDAEEHSGPELDQLVKDEKKAIARAIVNHHKDILREIEEIKAETGSGNHIVEANQMVLTAGQREALDIAHKLLWEQYEFDDCFGPAAEAIGDILRKAGGKDESRTT